MFLSYLVCHLDLNPSPILLQLIASYLTLSDVRSLHASQGGCQLLQNERDLEVVEELLLLL